MEALSTLILLFCVFLIVIQILIIVKFFQIAANIKSILQIVDVKKTPLLSKEFNYQFYSLIVADDRSEAKKILFEEISKSPQFQNIVNGGNDIFLANNSEELNLRFGKYLKALNLPDQDFLKIRTFI